MDLQQFEKNKRDVHAQFLRKNCRRVLCSQQASVAAFFGSALSLLTLPLFITGILSLMVDNTKWSREMSFSMTIQGASSSQKGD